MRASRRVHSISPLLDALVDGCTANLLSAVFSEHSYIGEMEIKYVK